MSSALPGGGGRGEIGWRRARVWVAREALLVLDCGGFKHDGTKKKCGEGSGTHILLLLLSSFKMSFRV
jgi:hypothetical protein